MAPPSHLASIRELRDIRRERPRRSGETEDQYYQQLASELERRQRAQRRRSLVVRVLRRDGHSQVADMTPGRVARPPAADDRRACDAA